MIDNGIEPNRINVAGYGEFRPLVDNINKKIEIKIDE